jgi:hypothetical protein
VSPLRYDPPITAPLSLIAAAVLTNVPPKLPRFVGRPLSQSTACGPATNPVTELVVVFAHEPDEPTS